MAPVHRFADGYSRRLLLLACIAIGAFAVDQVSKVVAAEVRPEHYIQNPSTDGIWWLPIGAALLACVVPFRPFTVALGLAVGGAAGNVFDVHVWPGGVPDFVYTPSLFENRIWNLADAFIVVGIAAAVAAVFVIWPLVLFVQRLRFETVRAAAEERVEPRAGGGRVADELDAVERAR